MYPNDEVRKHGILNLWFVVLVADLRDNRKSKIVSTSTTRCF